MIVKIPQFLGHKQKTTLEYSKQHQNQHVLSSQILWMQWNIGTDRCLYVWRIALKEMKSVFRDHLLFSMLILCFWMKSIAFIMPFLHRDILSLYSKVIVILPFASRKGLYIFILSLNMHSILDLFTISTTLKSPMDNIARLLRYPEIQDIISQQSTCAFCIYLAINSNYISEV